VSLGAAGQTTSLRFHHEQLASAEERDEQHGYWTDVLERVVVALDER
jgi:hypothetical protein